MRIIYAYIFRKLTTPFLFGITAFTGIFIGTDLLFELTEFYTQWGVGFLTLAKLFFLSLPSIIVLTFPMATLLATIMAYSGLAGNNEVTALRAGGVSIYKLVIPALILGLVVSVVTIGINEYVVPGANYIYNQTVYHFKHGKKKPKTQYNLYLTPLDAETQRPDYILYTHRFDGDTGTMNDVFLQNYEDGKPTTLVEAKKARWLEDEWHFFEGTIYHLEAGERVPSLEFQEYIAKSVFHEPDQISKLNKDTEDMSMRELSKYIKLLKKQGRSIASELIEWHHRLSIPFASFIFALLAAPLGIKPRRTSGSAMGMGLSIIVIFIYYAIMTFGDALGGQGAIPPWIGAWLQNIIFLVLGGVMLYRVGS